MPCAAPSRNNFGVLGPCAFPVVQAVAGVDVSAQNLCYPHYAMKWGQAGIPKGLMGGIDADTVFCWHADSLSEALGHSLTLVGDAKLDTAQSKFGGLAAAFDGVGDCITSPDSPDFAFGSGDFTIDLWAYFTNTAQTGQTLIAQSGFAAPNVSWMIRYDSGNALKLYTTVDGTALISSTWTWTPTANTWYHIAVVRSGSSAYLFVNGTQVGTPGAVAATVIDSSYPLTIGANSGNGVVPNQFFYGYLDEVRISKVARWTSNFSVPTAPYT